MVPMYFRLLINRKLVKIMLDYTEWEKVTISFHDNIEKKVRIYCTDGDIITGISNGYSYDEDDSGNNVCILRISDTSEGYDMNLFRTDVEKVEFID